MKYHLKNKTREDDIGAHANMFKDCEGPSPMPDYILKLEAEDKGAPEEKSGFKRSSKDAYFVMLSFWQDAHHSRVSGYFLMLAQDHLEMLKNMPGTPAFGYEASVEKNMCVLSHPELPEFIQCEPEPQLIPVGDGELWEIIEHSNGDALWSGKEDAADSDSESETESGAPKEEDEKEENKPEHLKWINLVEPSERAFLHMCGEKNYVVRPSDEQCVLLDYTDPILEVVNVAKDSHKMVVDSSSKQIGSKSRYVAKILSSKVSDKVEVICLSALEECERLRKLWGLGEVQLRSPAAKSQKKREASAAEDKSDAKKAKKAKITSPAAPETAATPIEEETQAPVNTGEAEPETSQLVVDEQDQEDFERRADDKENEKFPNTEEDATAGRAPERATDAQENEKNPTDEGEKAAEKSDSD
eukprot:s1083_g8.t1